MGSSTTTTSFSLASSTSRRFTTTTSSRSDSERSASCAPSCAATRRRRSTPSCAPGSHAPSTAALLRRLGRVARPRAAKVEPVLRSGAQTCDVRAMEHDDRDGDECRERDHRPRLADECGRHGQRARAHHRCERRVTEREEAQDPDAGADSADDRRNAEERTAAGRDHLPAALPTQEERTPVAQHRSRAGEDAGEVRDVDGREHRGDEALRRVDEHHGQAERAPEDAPHVRAADVPAAQRTDVDVLHGADEPVSRRDRPGEIAGDYCGRGGYFWIWYFDTQSLTVRQSRLSKNALM